MEDRFSVRRMGLRREPIEAADTTCVLERAKDAAIRSNIADGRLCCDASDIIALCVACSHRGDTGDSTARAQLLILIHLPPVGTAPVQQFNATCMVVRMRTRMTYVRSFPT